MMHMHHRNTAIGVCAPCLCKENFLPFSESELTAAFGENLLAEMKALVGRAPVDLRTNTLKSNRSNVLAQLQG